MNTINEIENLTSKVNELQKENEDLKTRIYILHAEPTEDEIDIVVKQFKIECLINKVNELQKENEDLKIRIQALRTEPSDEEIDKVIEHFKND